MDDFIVNALRLAGRPLALAELAALRFGAAPSDANRKATKAATRRLEAKRRVTVTESTVLNSRGQRRQQHVVALTGEAPALSQILEDNMIRASRTPDASAVLDSDGRVTDWDESAAHDYLAAAGLPFDPSAH